MTTADKQKKLEDIKELIEANDLTLGKDLYHAAIWLMVELRIAWQEVENFSLYKEINFKKPDGIEL